jgi:fatty acid elongase 3
MAPLADLILASVPYRLPYQLHNYVQGSTPMSTDKTVVAGIASYLAIIFGIQAVMKNQQPLKLTFLFQVHNVILSSGSLLLLALMLEEILPIAWKHGIHYALCDENSWTPVRVTLVRRVILIQHVSQRMEFYYICNYYFKYLEFIDTVFLALKKKPLRA